MDEKKIRRVIATYNKSIYYVDAVIKSAERLKYIKTSKKRSEF